MVVNLVTDLPLSETKCHPTANNSCTLRAAWKYCTLAAKNHSECRISLPAGETLYQNKSQGPLIFSSTLSGQQAGTIVLEGNGATVQGIQGGTQSSSVWKAMEVYRPVINSTDDPIVVSVCPGMTAIISTCDPDSYGDTVMRLYSDITQPPAKMNDDACGPRSRLDIATSELESTCLDYQVVVTCYDSAPCGAKIFVEYLSTSFYQDEKPLSSLNLTTSSQFISYSSSTTAIRLSLKNMTISSFGDIYANGGAISLWQGSGGVNITDNFLLKLESITLKNNVGANGGAIALMVDTAIGVLNEDGLDTLDITMKDVLFYNNSAIFRGGTMYIKDYSIADIAVVPSFSIVMECENVLFSLGNSDIGGAIALHSIRSADLSGFKISESSVITSGGGIDIQYSHNITLSSIEITNINIVANGGGMNLEHSEFITIDNVLMNSLTALSGGGIAGSNCSYIAITNSQFQYTVASWYGGSIRFYKSRIISIEDNTFYRVTSYYYGGAIAIMESQYLWLETLNIQRAFAPNGGGALFFNYTNHFTVQSITLYKVTSYFGAGLFINYCNNVNLRNHHISLGTAVYMGSGYQIDSSHSLLIQNIIVTNSMTISTDIGKGGGAIVIVYSTHSKLRNITITDVTSGHGSGLALYRSNYTDVSHVLVKGCSANDYAGGINVGSSQDMIFHNITVTNSSASRCGGFLVDFSSSLLFVNVFIEDTLATSSRGVGGGLCLLNIKKTTWMDSQVTGTQSQSHGGGVYVRSSSDIDLVRIDVTDCNTVNGDGGGYYFEQHNDNINLVDTITKSNSASSGSGGGFYISSLNSHLHWLDGLSYERNQTFTADKTTKHQSFHFHDAMEVIFYFSDDSDLNPDTDSCCTEFSILNDDTGVELFSNYHDYWPGIDQTPTILNNVTRLSVHYYNAKNLGNNKITITFIPVYPFASEGGRGGSETSKNVASSDGGGIVMSYLNPSFIMLHHGIDGNQAQSGSGGGIFLRSANSRSLIMNGNIFGNKAHVHGGGIYLGMSHSSMVLYGVQLIANNASTGKGGGQYMFSTNGYGGLDYGNQLNYSRCVFADNSAAVSGGGLYVQEQNALYLTETNFLNNIVTSDSSTNTGHGGGVGIGEQNELLMDKVRFAGNQALNGCGGGIAVTSKDNDLSLANIIVNDGKALTGGGICLLAYSTLSVQQRMLLHNNEATDAGGAIVLVKSPLWNCNDPFRSCDIIVSSNKAVRAAVLFLVAVPTTLSTSVGNVTITHNVATDGCLVEWVYDADSMPRPPSALVPQTMVSTAGLVYPSASVNRLSFFGNSALARMGTQPMRIHATQAVDVDQYDQAIQPYIVVRTADYYNRTVGDATLILDVAEHDCLEVKNPYVSGTSVSSTMTRGHTILTDLEAHCYPHGSLYMRITVPVDPIPSSLSASAESSGSCSSSSSDTSSYALTASTFLTFRGCRAGEYIENGNCVMCPNSTYSLIPISTDSTVTDSSLCQSCVSSTGVLECYGNTLVLEQGYWRRYEESDAVISCILGDISCSGGSGVGDGLCHEGYTGPLCAACADGYHMSNQECHPCGYHGFSYLQIISLVLFGLTVIALIIVAHHTYKKHRRKNKKPIPVTTAVIDNNEQKTDGNQETPPPTIPVEEEEEENSFSVFLTWCKTAFADIVVKVKIIVATFQVVTSTAEVFDVTMPESYAQFSKFFSVLNLNLSAIFPVGCLFPRINFIRRLLWTTIAPFAILIIIFFAMCIEYIYLKCKKPDDDTSTTSSKEEQDAEKEKPMKMIYRYVNVIFYLTYLVLPSVTTMIFRLFICKNVDPNKEDGDRYDTYLAADVNISCGSEYYRKWYWYGIAMIIVYPIGIPLFYFICLYRNRHEIRSRDDPEEFEEDEQQQEQEGSVHPLDKEKSNSESTELADSKTGMPLNPPARTRTPVRHNSHFSQHSAHSKIYRVASVSEVKSSPSCKLNNSPDQHHRASRKMSRLMSRKMSERVASIFAPTVSRPMLLHRISVKYDDLHEQAQGMAFLWEAYKPEFWYWELIETFRRMLLTSVLSICGTGTIQQTVFGIFLAYSFNKVYSYYQPYRVFSDFRLSEIGQTQIFLTYFITLILSGNIVDEKWHTHLGIALVLINVIVIGMGFCYECAEWFEEPHHDDEEDHDHHHNGPKDDHDDGVSSVGMSSFVLEQLSDADHSQYQVLVGNTPAFPGNSDDGLSAV